MPSTTRLSCAHPLRWSLQWRALGNGQRGTSTLGYATASLSFTTLKEALRQHSCGTTIPPYNVLRKACSIRPSIPALHHIAQGGGVSFDRPETAARSPYTEEWNFNIERELPFSMVGQIGYNGTQATSMECRVESHLLESSRSKISGASSLLQQAETPATLAQAQAQFPGIKLPTPTSQDRLGRC